MSSRRKRSRQKGTDGEWEGVCGGSGCSEAVLARWRRRWCCGQEETGPLYRRCQSNQGRCSVKGSDQRCGPRRQPPECKPPLGKGANAHIRQYCSAPASNLFLFSRLYLSLQTPMSCLKIGSTPYRGFLRPNTTKTWYVFKLILEGHKL